MLSSYPVILLAGSIDFTQELVADLGTALAAGSTLLVSPRHREALADAFRKLQDRGRVEVLEPWNNPATGRPAAISAERLAQITRDTLPVEVIGDAIQFQINRVPTGWVVELVNNRGVFKKPDAPAVIDPNAIQHVGLRPRVPCLSAREWKSGRVHATADAVSVEVPPGQTEFVEFTLPP